MFVTGIDLGSTFSGFAWSDQHNWINVRNNMYISGRMISQKCPSVLLLNPDKSFLAFGYEAQRVFKDLREDSYSDSDSSDSNSQDETGYITTKTWRNYYYFPDFKMFLQKKKVSC